MLLRGRQICQLVIPCLLVKIAKVLKLQFSAVPDALIAVFDKHGTLTHHLRLLALPPKDILNSLMYQLIGVLRELRVVELLQFIKRQFEGIDLPL